MAMQKDLEFFFGLGSVAYAVSQSLSSMSQKGGISLKELIQIQAVYAGPYPEGKPGRCEKENRPLKPEGSCST